MRTGFKWLFLFLSFLKLGAYDTTGNKGMLLDCMFFLMIAVAIGDSKPKGERK